MKKFLVLLLSAFISASAISQTIYENGNIAEDTISVDEVTVTASYKATKSTPFSFKNITSKEIDLRGRNQEPAGLLKHTPSVTYNTDNGLFTGYSYFRLRGIDQSRINVTLNGVPMNEPEDQGIFFNNHPNFLQIVSDVQVVRGAGLTKSGVSTYGGSINFDSQDGNLPNEISLNYGSYNTWNATAQATVKNGWVRASYLSTDGYKHHSGNDSYSLFYGYDVVDFKLLGFVGKQYNQMAWIGSSKEKIEEDRRYNANRPLEEDEFLYVHHQLHYSNPSKIFNAVLFHTHLNGWYNMDFGHFDGNFNQFMYKLQLNSHWIGADLKVNAIPHTFAGIYAHTYKRDHTNSMAVPDVYETYNENYGKRHELAPYIKTSWDFGPLNVYADVQYRLTTFDYYDVTRDFWLDQHTWNFLNWSVGSTFRMTEKLQLYGGFGRNHREPTRTDLFGGFDEYTEENYTEVVPEMVDDLEIGAKFYGNKLLVNLNGYYMKFKNEIVLNGQVGPNSIVIHSNVAESHRSGVELDVKYENEKWRISNVTSLSDNVIHQDGTEITHVLSPSLVTTSDIVYKYGLFTSGTSLRYNGESYLDFANEHKIPSYFVLDFFQSIKFSKFDIIFRLNNVFNELYYTYGNIGFDGMPAYFQQVGVNFSLSLKYQF